MSNQKVDAVFDAAEKLARALGHATNCPKVQCICKCGAGLQQAAALDNWQQLKLSLSSEDFLKTVAWG